MPTNQAVCESKEIRDLGQFSESSWRGGGFHQNSRLPAWTCSLLHLHNTSDLLILCNLRPHPWRVTRCVKPSELFTKSLNSSLLHFQASTIIKYVFSKDVISCSFVTAPFTFLNRHKHSLSQTMIGCILGQRFPKSNYDWLYYWAEIPYVKLWLAVFLGR